MAPQDVALGRGGSGNQVPGTYAKDYVVTRRKREVTAFIKKGDDHGSPRPAVPVGAPSTRTQAAARPHRGEPHRRLRALGDGQGGARVVLDPHNYARYYDQVVGAGVPDDAFADLWSRLAIRFGSNPLVVFGLVNEPHDLPAEQWARAAQAAILAIRATKARNLILVPGVAWSGASVVGRAVLRNAQRAGHGRRPRDPLNNDAFEVPPVPRIANRSGTSPDCVSRTVGSES